MDPLFLLGYVIVCLVLYVYYLKYQLKIFKRKSESLADSLKLSRDKVTHLRKQAVMLEAKNVVMNENKTRPRKGVLRDARPGKGEDTNPARNSPDAGSPYYYSQPDQSNQLSPVTFAASTYSAGGGGDFGGRRSIRKLRQLLQQFEL